MRPPARANALYLTNPNEAVSKNSLSLRIVHWGENKSRIIDWQSLGVVFDSVLLMVRQ